MILLALGALGAFLLARRPAPSKAPVSERIPSGQLARVRVTVPLEYVESIRSRDLEHGQAELVSDVGERVSKLGFGRAMLVTQDPTDNRAFSVIARARGGAPSSTGDDVVRLVSVEPVEEPPSGIRKPSAASTGLDPGLSADEVLTVRYALANEHHPAHLWGLAVTFEPSFPIAAGLLHKRRRELEEGGSLKTAPSPKPDLSGLQNGLQAYANEHQIPPDLLREEVRRTTCLLVGGQPGEAPPPVFAAARACSPSYGTIDRRALSTLAPFHPKDTFVSPAAIQLALSSSKPLIAGVRNAARGRVVRRDVEGADVPNDPTARAQSLRARSAMLRARKAIERRRWVEWYRRSQAWT